MFLNVFDQSDCQSFPEAVFLFLMLFLAYGYLDLSLLLLLLAWGCVGNRLDRLPLSFAQQLEVWLELCGRLWARDRFFFLGALELFALLIEP